MNQGSMKYWITIVLFVVITFPVISQQYRSELPYRLVGGKMIVEMKLNGTLRSFIFDTGASRTMLTEDSGRLVTSDGCKRTQGILSVSMD